MKFGTHAVVRCACVSDGGRKRVCVAEKRREYTAHSTLSPAHINDAVRICVLVHFLILLVYNIFISAVVAVSVTVAVYIFNANAIAIACVTM